MVMMEHMVVVRINGENKSKKKIKKNETNLPVRSFLVVRLRPFVQVSLSLKKKRTNNVCERKK
jgi:hypothetical protein